MPSAPTIRPVTGPAELETVRRLFREYQESLGVDLCFQGFEAELAGLPGAYRPPGGGLWIAWAGEIGAGEKALGCVALRPLAGKVERAGGEEGACEMKRLYLRPAARGLGLGRQLAETAIRAATAAGHRRMLLDTLVKLEAARSLYATLGFHEVPAYYDNPLPSVCYLARDLDPPA